uniref:Uncharacterized protein n=1 Tax=Anopheles funestus TaxID=62324 RepID=A0A4Y0BKA4_ANOFN
MNLSTSGKKETHKQEKWPLSYQTVIGNQIQRNNLTGGEEQNQPGR